MTYETIEQKKSRAKRIRNLFIKQKKLIGSLHKTVDFIEPVILLHTRGGNTQFYENATGDRFYFKHSNGQDRYIDLIPSKMETMDYFGRKIRFYDCHEDRPYPGWEQPVVDAESVAISHEKTRSSLAKYEEKLLQAKTASRKSWIYIILGIAGAIALILFAIRTWYPELITKAPAVKTEAPVVIPQIIALLIGRKKK